MNSREAKDLVSAVPLEFSGRDARGVTGEVETDGRSGKFILAYRKSGSISGNHFHKGGEAAKDPEILLFLQGRAEISYATIDEKGNKGSMMKLEAVAPCRIEVYPWCWHEFLFTEDSCFLELNSFEQGDRDSYRL